MKLTTRFVFFLSRIKFVLATDVKNSITMFYDRVLASTVTSIKETISTAITKIKTTISTAITNAKTTISDAITKIQKDVAAEWRKFYEDKYTGQEPTE